MDTWPFKRLDWFTRWDAAEQSLARKGNETVLTPQRNAANEVHSESSVSVKVRPSGIPVGFPSESVGLCGTVEEPNC